MRAHWYAKTTVHDILYHNNQKLNITFAKYQPNSMHITEIK